jgi:hypothetical protein
MVYISSSECRNILSSIGLDKKYPYINANDSRFYNYLHSLVKAGSVYQRTGKKFLMIANDYDGHINLNEYIDNKCTGPMYRFRSYHHYQNKKLSIEKFLTEFTGLTIDKLLDKCSSLIFWKNQGIGIPIDKIYKMHLLMLLAECFSVFKLSIDTKCSIFINSSKYYGEKIFDFVNCLLDKNIDIDEWFEKYKSDPNDDDLSCTRYIKDIQNFLGGNIDEIYNIEKLVYEHLKIINSINSNMSSFKETMSIIPEYDMAYGIRSATAISSASIKKRAMKIRSCRPYYYLYYVAESVGHLANKSSEPTDTFKIPIHNIQQVNSNMVIEI